MAATAFVRARIDETHKDEAAAVLAEQCVDVHLAKDADDLYGQLGI